ncbi:MAG: hypothetical protein IKH36_00670 [Bacilli bacterium]|nr:hypothetical protein [Bacilli bacterium]MBR4672166.1 hypothetical protein [Bacilli bacterium]
MNRTSRRLKRVYLLILFLFTLAMLSTTTYAWFTSNRIVTVNTINVHVAASGGIEISADGTNWKSIITPEDITSVHATTYPTSVNQIPYSLEPVSSGLEVDPATGLLKIYYGLTDNNTLGDYIITSTRSVETEGNGATNNGKFIVFDLFFKVSSDTQLYLTSNSKVTYLNTEQGKGIANATRIVFVNEGTVPTGSDLATIQGLRNANNNTVYSWEPNYDIHTQAAVNHAYNLYGIITQTENGNRIIYDGITNDIAKTDNVLLRNAKATYFPTKFKTVMIDYYTKNDFTANVPVFTLESGITKMRIYMWIEGQDVDCENDASYDDIQFDLQLTVNPS